jgi:hypothetical protein
MNRTLTFKNSSLVFTQWSRKSYAIFASLGKEVQIGHLDEGVCEKAIDKNKTKKSSKENWNNFSLIETDDPDELMLVNTDLQLISLISETINSDESSQHCCSLFTIYNFRNLTFHPVLQDAENYK